MVQTTKATKPISATRIVRAWHLVDAKDAIVGRIATDIAYKLQGKHKTSYVPYLDSGDYFVVINAKNIRLTGKKENMKVYSSYSGYPGGLKTVTARQLRERRPDQILKNAVSGMLPKNKQRKRMMARLYVFPGDTHPYAHKFVTNA